jgi:DNA invertase Pin-like site-specific DNA recombinase
MTIPASFRCAIYTRKSTEEGLEQDFNSLDAQRESCAAYILSQASLGWKSLPEHYDDGGISGGTLERPALQSLLADIKSRKVDVVVVYKIDRLTRSLMDFARIVEVFDAHKVSFVSVTQQFNTLSSMGRLTLNVLLSFAQFEREVTAERIRDKIAASKKKGMWMGGAVPLGYRVENRKLVIHPEEAETVRQIFRLYLEIGSVRRLKEKLDEVGILTGIRAKRDGTSSGGKPFSRGHLHWLLSNPIYAGDLRHKEKIVKGQHQPIIGRDLWDAAQQQIKQQTTSPVRSGRLRDRSLLCGLLYDETGDRLTPSHAVKKGRRYRYYISQRLMQARRRDQAGWRLPGEDLETRVIASIRDLLKDHKRLCEITDVEGREAQAVQQMIDRAVQILGVISSPPVQEARDFLKAIIKRIDIEPGQMSITISDEALVESLGIERKNVFVAQAEHTLKLPFELHRRGVETRLILRSELQRPPIIDPLLVETIARAMNWLARLTSGKDMTIAELARQDGIDDGEISRVLPLAFLSPGIVEAIVQGRQPVTLTATYLKRLKPLEFSWAEQRQLLGFGDQSGG